MNPKDKYPSLYTTIQNAVAEKGFSEEDIGTSYVYCVAHIVGDVNKGCLSSLLTGSSRIAKNIKKKFQEESRKYFRSICNNAVYLDLPNLSVLSRCEKAEDTIEGQVQRILSEDLISNPNKLIGTCLINGCRRYHDSIPDNPLGHYLRTHEEYDLILKQLQQCK